MITTDYRERYETERIKRLEERIEAADRALALQAAEYERRLSSLNHAHEKAIEVQHTYVTQDKYEQNLLSESEKREFALDRVNEKFDDYIKRYELRQREIDQALAISRGANDQAKSFAEEAARKANRNIAIATLILGSLVALSNWIPSIT